MANSISSDLELVITLRLANQNVIWPFYNGAILLRCYIIKLTFEIVIDNTFISISFSFVLFISFSLVSLLYSLCSEVKNNLYKMESFNEIDDLELIKLV